MSVDGNSWSLKERVSGFRNVPELLKMFHVAADVKTAEDLDLPTPAIARRGDGQRVPELISVPATQAQRDFVISLGERADAVRKKLVEPTVDNMLKISSEGRAAALDLRLLSDDAGQTLHLRSVEHARDVLHDLPRLPFHLVHAVVHDEMCGMQDGTQDTLRVPISFNSSW